MYADFGSHDDFSTVFNTPDVNLLYGIAILKRKVYQQCTLVGHFSETCLLSVVYKDV